MLITRQLIADLDRQYGDGTYVVVGEGVVAYYPAPEFGTHRGYAVALKPLFENGEDMASVGEGTLIETWRNPETDAIDVDRVAHVKGSVTEALAIARAFNQAAIFDFQSGYVMTVEGEVNLDDDLARAKKLAAQAAEEDEED